MTTSLGEIIGKDKESTCLTGVCRHVVVAWAEFARTGQFNAAQSTRFQEPIVRTWSGEGVAPHTPKKEISAEHTRLVQEQALEHTSIPASHGHVGLQKPVG
mmetsp:Transcript_12666/g.29413  ORF Transcript_12666/g.29413 Transcript_12666/m.29413 type:complete len:101 (-) Transcript_12666:488-790(-)